MNNLYDEICKLENIISMTNMVCKHSKNKKKVNNFEKYKIEHIVSIKNKLDSKNYVPGSFNIFMISDPKVRIIMNQSIEDKIINHLVSYYILNKVFENTFTESMIATRKGRGIRYGVELLRKYLNKLKNDNFYVLKLDIKKYFYNINQDILKEIIRKKIKDIDAINIIERIIESTNHDYINIEINRLKEEKIKNICDENIIDEINKIPEYKKGVGLSIGCMSSQIFGLIYLNEFNHYSKEELHLKYVINYMDDMIILHKYKNYLYYILEQIKDKLKEYKLELNLEKSKINSIKNGIDFVGYKFYIEDKKIIIRLRNRTKKNFIKKVNKVNNLYNLGYIDKKEYDEMMGSYKSLKKYNRSLYARKIIQIQS